MGKHKKHNIRPTSIESYKELRAKLGERQLFVFNGFTELCQTTKDASDAEVAQFLGVDTNVVRPRRFELVNEFKALGFNKKRHCSVSNKRVMVWKVLRRSI